MSFKQNQDVINSDVCQHGDKQKFGTSDNAFLPPLIDLHCLKA